MVFSLLLFVAILFSDEQDSGISNIHYGGVNVSAEVLAHKPMVEKYAKEYGVEEYVNILLAIIQVESGGTAEDVMQSSESLGLPPNSLSTEESIKQGVKYFSELLASSERLSVDLESVIQSYNYGGGFLGYVANRGNKYTFELAQSFSKEYSKSFSALATASVRLTLSTWIGASMIFLHHRIMGKKVKFWNTSPKHFRILCNSALDAYSHCILPFFIRFLRSCRLP